MNSNLNKFSVGKLSGTSKTYPQYLLSVLHVNCRTFNRNGDEKGKLFEILNHTFKNIRFIKNLV